MKRTILSAVIASMMLSCQKDYSVKPSPFKVGDKVKLNGIDPRKSYKPYDCCTCQPCTVDSAYTLPDNIYWYYKIHDIDNKTLSHVTNDQLKRY